MCEYSIDKDGLSCQEMIDNRIDLPKIKDDEVVEMVRYISRKPTNLRLILFEIAQLNPGFDIKYYKFMDIIIKYDDNIAKGRSKKKKDALQKPEHYYYGMEEEEKKLLGALLYGYQKKNKIAFMQAEVTATPKFNTM